MIEINSHKFIIDGCLIGDRWGELEVVSNPFRKGPYNQIYVACLCDCGNFHDVFPSRLRRKLVTRCGSCSRRQPNLGTRTHGMWNTPEWKSWTAMKTRCLNPNASDYSRYGGSGITICKEWIDSFELFFSDMGPRPKGMTLDRKNSCKGYCKDNCRWATYKTQVRNRKNTVYFTMKGETLTVFEWSERFNIRYGTVMQRVSKGKSMEYAITTPVNTSKRNRHYKGHSF